MVDLSIGPKEGVEYPVDTQYCGNCTMPIEVSFPETSHVPILIRSTWTLSVLRVLSGVREMQGMAGEESAHRVREDEGG